jgi:hypothetical protein
MLKFCTDLTVHESDPEDNPGPEAKELRLIGPGLFFSITLRVGGVCST